MGDLASSGAGPSSPSLFTGGRHALSEVVFVLPLRGRTPDRREELHGAGRVSGLRQFDASLRQLHSPLAHPAYEGAVPATGFLDLRDVANVHWAARQRGAQPRTRRAPSPATLRVERALRGYKAGEKVETTVLRAGKTTTVTLTFQDGDSTVVASRGR
jgi:hypothetical protein